MIDGRGFWYFCMKFKIPLWQLRSQLLKKFETTGVKNETVEWKKIRSGWKRG
jgi:hypothetical protein